MQVMVQKHWILQCPWCNLIWCRSLVPATGCPCLSNYTGFLKKKTNCSLQTISTIYVALPVTIHRLWFVKCPLKAALWDFEPLWGGTGPFWPLVVNEIKYHQAKKYYWRMKLLYLGIYLHIQETHNTICITLESFLPCDIIEIFTIWEKHLSH